VGTWGTALYADDTALDLRNDWGTGMRWGRKAEELADELAKQYGEETTFWLVLADLQWKCGHVVPRVRERALEIIASGADLERWTHASAKDRKARSATLGKLGVQLETAPPPPRVYKPPKGAATPMKIGEVYAWQLLDGRFAFIHVCGICRNCGPWPAPSFRVLDVVSERVLSLEELARLPSRKTVRPFPLTEKLEPTFLEHPMAAPGTYGPGQYPKTRLQRLGVLAVPVGLDNNRKVIGSSWLGADQLFPTMYGIGWEVGDVVAWKREGAPPVVLSICEIATLTDGRIWPYVTFEILAWSHTELPEAHVLRNLKPIVTSGGRLYGPRLSVKGCAPAGRVQTIGRIPRGPSNSAAGFFDWTKVDAVFDERLALAEPLTDPG
jgi:hypothetical protein